MSLPGRILYTGSHRHNLDDKGRLTIPSSWRSAHAETDEFLAIPNPAGHISVLPPSEVQKLYDKVAAVPEADAEAQAQIAVFFALAQSFTFDKQGRYALSDALRKHAGIAKESVLVGSLSKFNIYSSERWTATEEKQATSGAAGFLTRYQI